MGKKKRLGVSVLSILSSVVQTERLEKLQNATQKTTHQIIFLTVRSPFMYSQSALLEMDGDFQL
jgi:hypothetical protein